MNPAVVVSRATRTATLVMLVILFPMPGARAQISLQFTTDFRMEACTFSNTGGENPYYINLTPGHWLKLEGYEGPNFVEVLITAQPATKVISFPSPRGTPMTVTARVVEEREWINSELVEVSRNWFARCTLTNDMFYLGEDVDIYQNGQIVSHDGSWKAGQLGAYPGVVMPGSFMPGARYYQELAGVAKDRSENIAMGLATTVPYGNLTRCVRVRETSPLEPGEESFKVYCEGIGLVIDSAVQLTARGFPLGVN